MKWVFLVILLYILSPVDALPDVIPLLGGADDTVAAIIGMILAHRNGKRALPPPG